MRVLDTVDAAVSEAVDDAEPVFVAEADDVADDEGVLVADLLGVAVEDVLGVDVRVRVADGEAVDVGVLDGTIGANWMPRKMVFVGAVAT